uniref:Septin-type G domain-containing protein n=1 Tax=Neolamprologus brichardi TaxID=32507 RepID=A0A3Q4M8H2_NEOBR
LCFQTPLQNKSKLEGGVQPNQVHWKSVKRGFEFTLMVVGESGLGKSTLINSLFLTDLYSKDCPALLLCFVRVLEFLRDCTALSLGATVNILLFIHST